MHTKKKVTGTAMAIPAGLGIGIGVSLVVTLLGAALTAWLIGAERIGEASIGYGAMAILVLASAVGAFVSSSLIKRLRLQICLLSGVGYFLTLLGMTALFFGGQYQGMGVSSIAVLIGCVAVAFMPGKSSPQGKRRKFAYH